MRINIENSMYGRVEAPCLWYEKLKMGLKESIFKKSEPDTCSLFQIKLSVLYMCITV